MMMILFCIDEDYSMYKVANLVGFCMMV